MCTQCSRNSRNVLRRDKMPEPNHSVDKSPCDFRTFVQNMSLINTTVSNTFLPTLLVHPRCYNSGFSLPDCLEHLFASIHGASENFNSPQHQSKTSWLRARDGKTTTAEAIYHLERCPMKRCCETPIHTSICTYLRRHAGLC